jgi:hypothetical protein
MPVYPGAFAYCGRADRPSGWQALVALGTIAITISTSS